MVKRIIVAILLLPVAEFATFVVIAALIGLGWAMALTVATSVAGLLVLRGAGRGRIARFRNVVSEARVTGIEADIGSFLTVLGGVLLLLPGFLTDCAGALLLLRPARRRFAAYFHQTVMGAGRGGTRSVVDLEPDEWRQIPDRDATHDRDNGSRR